MTSHQALIVVAAGLLAGCALPRPTESAESLKITRVTTGKSPCGWIYAFHRRSGAPDACVFIWSPEKWSLALETKPGHYSTEPVEGRIKDGVAVGFPTDVLLDARTVYAAGGIAAALGDRPIREGGVSLAAAADAPQTVLVPDGQRR